MSKREEGFCSNVGGGRGGSGPSGFEMPVADWGPVAPQHHPCSLFPAAGLLFVAASCSSSLAALSSAKE